MRIAFVLLAAASLLACPGASWAWDNVYDGSAVPTYAATGWGAQGNLSMCSSDGSVLLIDDVRTDIMEGFDRSVDMLGAYTLEARVRVEGQSTDPLATLAVGTAYSVSIGIGMGYVGVYFDYGNAPITYAADMSEFHTLRIALTSGGQGYVWLDQVLIAQGISHVEGSGGLYFAGPSRQGVGRAYWDYVAYSHSFEPVPEPSSLLVLVAGVGGFGALLRRRRR